MKPCRVILVFLAIIVCVGIISVCTYASSSDIPDYTLPEVVAPVTAEEDATGEVLENNDDIPVQTVSGVNQAQGTEPSDKAYDESNVIANNEPQTTEAIISSSETIIESTDNVPQLQTVPTTTPEASKNLPETDVPYSEDDETKTDEGLRVRVVKIAENQEEVVLDYSSWELAILVAIWLLVTFILFVGAIMLVLRLTRR